VSHATPAKLVLFDVDGTLLVTGGAGSRAIKAALKRLIGEGFVWHPITPGLLDPQIYAELAQKNGFAQHEAGHDTYQQHYLDALQRELEIAGDQARLLPGVRGLIEQLSRREDVVIGLLTGNYRRGVEMKLAAANIPMEVFQINAFAEDGRSRDQLVRHAMSLWQRRAGRAIEPGRVFIIGDTPRDVACAKAVGCRSVAVATGWYTERQLRDEGAELVLPDFSDPAPFLELLQPTDA